MKLLATTFLVGLACLGASNALQAASVPLPPALLVDGKPISPACFNQMEEAQGGIDVKKCENPELTYDRSGALKADNDGIISLYYSEGKEARESGAFDSYRYLGQVADGYVVETITNGGGSGVFSAVSVYDIKDGKLQTKRFLQGGDRCMDGIVDSKVEDGKIILSHSVTPFSMTYFNLPKEEKYQKNSQLDQCATCCAGMVTMTDNQITSLELTQDYVVENAEAFEKSQKCFNGLFTEELSTTGAQLNAQQAQDFALKLQKQCEE